MNLKATLIAGGLAAALCTGAAFAQNYSQNAPAAQQAPYGHHHRGMHGVMGLIREEVDAGRISQKEGTLLMEKIKEMKQARRAERQAPPRRHAGQLWAGLRSGQSAAAGSEIAREKDRSKAASP